MIDNVHQPKPRHPTGKRHHNMKVHMPRILPQSNAERMIIKASGYARMHRIAACKWVCLRDLLTAGTSTTSFATAAACMFTVLGVGVAPVCVAILSTVSFTLLASSHYVRAPSSSHTVTADAYERIAIHYSSREPIPFALCEYNRLRHVHIPQWAVHAFRQEIFGKGTNPVQ